ncbi:MAG: 1,4-alpha-glucan branching protein GlgB, partial [Clostridiaceae bacterium]
MTEAEENNESKESAKKAHGIKSDKSNKIKHDISQYDVYLFHQGTHYNTYDFMGAHLVTEKRKKGVRFTTWAPNASEVYVVGNFNNWKMSDEYSLKKVTKSGLWTLFKIGNYENQIYKYLIVNLDKG